MFRPAIAGLLTIAACGGGAAAKPEAAPSAPVVVDAGVDASDGGEERPFASSSAEATSMISEAVDKKQQAVKACVREFRTRKKIERARVMLSIGIDQEGKVLGVTSKGREDVELKSCVQTALKDAPFPRSHAGVITLTKTYEELLQ